MMLSVAIPVSKLAGRKAAASCRTPKRAAPAQAVVALSACPDEFFRSLFSPAQPQNADPALRGRRYAKLHHYPIFVSLGGPHSMRKNSSKLSF
ncbi:MAG: hypothetical protein ACLQVM_29240 [Terriglobia bacterium]